MNRPAQPHVPGIIHHFARKQTHGREPLRVGDGGIEARWGQEYLTQGKSGANQNSTSGLVEGQGQVRRNFIFNVEKVENRFTLRYIND